jgi:hypothetical protein
MSDEFIHGTRIPACDVTSIIKVSVAVEGFQYDGSIMEHPEYLISTSMVFQSKQYGGMHLQTKWTTYRTFEEFQGMDSQLRRSFTSQMSLISTLRVHHFHRFFHLHRRKAFLNRRVTELDHYIHAISKDSSMRLLHFVDPRAPPYLRCFCNFDSGFGYNVSFRVNQLDGCTLCLDEVQENDQDIETSLDDVAFVDLSVKSQENVLKEQQQQRPHWRKRRQRTDSKFDELEANLLDDRARNMVMCSWYGCACQNASFVSTWKKMQEILASKGYVEKYHPGNEGVSALYCIMYHLQEHGKIKGGEVQLRSIQLDEQVGSSPLSFTQSVDFLRESLANYGLLHIDKLATTFRMNCIDLKKKLHAFKNKRNDRVGAIELVILCTMLDMSMKLLTNDHTGTIQDIYPLPQYEPIRRGGRIIITMAYLLPNEHYIDGFYSLVEKNDGEQKTSEYLMGKWLGSHDLDVRMIHQIDELLSDELEASYDHTTAEKLNRAILDAVWNDCQHNPNLFHLFQRQARQFGKSRITAAFFLQYLEVAFGVEGAIYLIDFLLHVLPEEELRRQLLRARWQRVRRQLIKRHTVV